MKLTATAVRFGGAVLPASFPLRADRPLSQWP